MSHVLQFRTAQSLAMTPQLQQSLRLLQLSALEFEQEMARARAENPFLEAEEDGPAPGADGVHGSALERMSPEDVTSAGPGTRARLETAETASVGTLTPAPVSLRDHLMDQLGSTRLAGRDRLLAALIVESLDDDGYLRQSLEELREIVRPGAEVEPGELEIALRFVQSLEPAGVAARSPAECLALQLANRPDTPARALALRIVGSHIDMLAMHDTTRLMQALGCDEPALHRAHDLIQRLDPHPGSQFGTPGVRYVVADVLVRKVRGRWVAAINPQVLPRIRVNEMYADIYRGSREINPGLSQQLQEARWLVRSAQQRFQTVQRVAQAIVDRQRRYFDYGDVAMKPLMQRDIAREVGVHESTVSRVANGKYMITPRGMIEFRHFFGTHVFSEDGHACSSTAIRALIRQIIGHERPGAPLSDIKVTRKLAEFGVRVARRTVTKYRDAMRIPPVEARRLGAGIAPERAGQP